MPRSLSALAKGELFKRSSSMLLPVLMQLDHSTFDDPVSLVNNTEAIVYGGATYLPFAFRFDPPDETATTLTNARLTIDAVDQSILALLRGLPSSPTVTMKAVFYYDETGTIQTEQLAAWEFSVANLSYNVDTISCDLIYEDRWQNQMGAVEITPYTMPGLF